MGGTPKEAEHKADMVCGGECMGTTCHHDAAHEKLIKVFKNIYIEIRYVLKPVVRFQGFAIILNRVSQRSKFCMKLSRNEREIIFFRVRLVNFDNVTLQCEPLVGWSGTTSCIAGVCWNKYPFYP